MEEQLQEVDAFRQSVLKLEPTSTEGLEAYARLQKLVLSDEDFAYNVFKEAHLLIEARLKETRNEGLE